MKGSKYNENEREQALAMIASGLTISKVSKIMDIPRSTIADWHYKAQLDDDDFLAARRENRRKMVNKSWKVVEQGLNGMDKQVKAAAYEKKQIDSVIQKILKSDSIDDKTSNLIIQIVTDYTGISLSQLSRATKSAYEIHQDLEKDEQTSSDGTTVEGYLNDLEHKGDADYEY